MIALLISYIIYTRQLKFMSIKGRVMLFRNRRSGIKYGEREFLDRAFPASCISWKEKCSGCEVTLAEGEQPLDGELWGHLDSTDRTGWDKISVCTKVLWITSTNFLCIWHDNILKFCLEQDYIAKFWYFFCAAPQLAPGSFSPWATSTWSTWLPH